MSSNYSARSKARVAYSTHRVILDSLFKLVGNRHIALVNPVLVELLTVSVSFPG